MELELQETLANCSAAIDKMIELLEGDTEDMSQCINGEILEEYSSGTREALRLAQEIQDALRILQEAG